MPKICTITIFIKSLLLSTLIIVTCTLPLDPDKNPNVVDADIIQIDPVPPLNIVPEKQATFGIIATYPKHVDSVTVSFDDLRINDTTVYYKLRKSQPETAFVNFTYTTTGIKTLKAITNLTNGSTKSFKKDFNVAPKIQTVSFTVKPLPHFAIVNQPDTLIFIAKANSSKNDIIFKSSSLPPLGEKDIKLITNKDTAILIVTPKEKNVYTIKCHAIYGDASDSTNVAVTAYEKPLFTTSSGNDTQTVRTTDTLRFWLQDTSSGISFSFLDSGSYKPNVISSLVTTSDNIYFVFEPDEVKTYSFSFLVKKGSLTDTITYQRAVINDTGKTLTIKTNPDFLVLNEDDSLKALNVLGNDTISSGALILTSVVNGKKGSATIKDGVIWYLPLKDEYGKDTVLYTVNDIKTESVFITINQVNDKPRFVNADTLLNINEKEQKTIVFRATDPDLISPVLKITSKPSWVTVRDSIDSVSVLFQPLASATTANKSPLIDSVVISATDGVETVTHVCKIKLFNINAAPVFSAPETTVVIKEGTISTVKYNAVDTDGGDNTILSLIPAPGIPVPGWVSATGTVDNITLTFKPDYSIATTSTPLHKTIISLKATDGIDSTIIIIKVNVQNVNRKPVFTKAPQAIINCPTGDTLKAEFATNDPDSDVVSFSQVSKIDNVTINQTTKTLIWLIPREKYSFKNSVDITIRASDGGSYSDSTFKVAIGTHIWRLRNSNVVNQDPNLFTADGTNKVFYVNNVVTAVKVFQSLDAGVSFNDLPIATFGSSNYYPKWIEAHNGKIFIVGNGPIVPGFLLTLNCTSGIISDSQSLGSTNSFTVDPSGACVLISNTQFHTSSYLYIKTTTINSNYTIPTTFKSLASGTKYFWGISADSGVCYMQNIDISSPMKGFTATRIQSDLKCVVCDGNNGDTAYAFEDSVRQIYKATITDPRFIPATISISSYIAGILMLSGTAGWIWTTNGEVYFTNNGFLTYYRETLLDNTGKEVKIRYMFKSSDNNTVYAISKNESNIVSIFRY